MRQKRRYRSIFISDVHLGTADCQADYLLDFLRHTECETLYLVGDIIDLEALRQRVHWTVAQGAVVGELLERAARGTRVIYIPGNHDAPLRGLAGGKIGDIEVRLDAVHVGADGRRFRVSHGDEYDEEGLGKRLIVRIGDRGHRLLCWLNRSLNRLRRRFGLPYFPLSVITKSRIGRALDYIQRFEHKVAARARAEGFDGHICGHIHFGGIRRVDGVLYLNDGDWVEHCTAIVELPNGRMELLHWTERQGALAASSREELLPSPAAALAFARLAVEVEQAVQEAA
jgi:UDP-2,3-diacylglucosamine pyrophosphatase LpxH